MTSKISTNSVRKGSCPTNDKVQRTRKNLQMHPNFLVACGILLYNDRLKTRAVLPSGGRANDHGDAFP